MANPCSIPLQRPNEKPPVGDFDFTTRDMVYVLYQTHTLQFFGVGSCYRKFHIQKYLLFGSNAKINQSN
jgi:hypothetical protein